MAHPRIDNETPFEVEALYSADEDGRPLVAPLVRATFDVAPSGELTHAPEQRPIALAGEYHGEAGASSLRFEPEVAFEKPGTDVVLLGHAHAPRGRVQEVEVELRVGPLSKRALVCGDRTWRNGLLGARPSDPAPFERIPLVWERAFGGWDRTHEDPAQHRCEPRNPLGVGFHRRGSPFEEDAPLPNIEDPGERLTRYRGRPRPIGFGFTGAEWPHRGPLAGTFDERWKETRQPLLPVDFDRRFFNAAAEGLASRAPLRGDEPVLVRNATPDGRLEFRLPGLAPPSCLVARRVGGDVPLGMRLDTIVIDADARQLFMTWRAFTSLRDGPHDVSALRFELAAAVTV